MRESSAEMISNDGFSVVAPMSRMLPFSTCGRKASCCALLKRWISSTNTSVRVPYWRARSGCAMTSFVSLIPLSTAENSRNSAWLERAVMCASVVLPVPGGPQNRMLPVSSRSMATRSGLPGPRMCSCPMNSSSVRGRMRSASGRDLSMASESGMGANRLIGLRRASLPGDLVEQDGSRHARVQRLDFGGVRDHQRVVEFARDFSGQAGTLVADEQSERSFQVGVGSGRAFVRGGSENAQAAGAESLHGFGGVHA